MCVHLPLHFDWVVMIHKLPGFADSAGRIDQVCDHLRHTIYKLLANFIFLHLTQSQRKAIKYITKLFICFLTKTQTIVKYKKIMMMMLLRRSTTNSTINVFTTNITNITAELSNRVNTMTCLTDTATSIFPKGILFFTSHPDPKKSKFIHVQYFFRYLNNLAETFVDPTWVCMTMSLPQ